MLEKVTTQRLEISDDFTIFVVRLTSIFEDGVQITEPTRHRNTYEPGADISKETDKVQAIAALLWTPEVIEAYQRKANAG